MNGRAWWRSPAMTTLAATVTALGVFAGIVAFALDRAQNRDYVDGAFRNWAAVATVSLLVSVVLLLRGIAAVRALPSGWTRGRAWWTWNLLAYVVLGATAALLLNLVVSGSNHVRVPIRDFAVLIQGLTLAGWISGAPWLLLVWLTHEQVGLLAVHIGRIVPPQPVGGFSPARLDALVVAAAVQATAHVWQTIERCALVLALLVSTAVVNTGALRATLIMSHAIPASDFPPGWVLGYGAFFATLVAAVVVPLVLAWRTQAYRLIDRALGEPVAGIPDDTYLAARTRLETHLHIDAQILRRPIAALSVLSPIGTAALTAFIGS
ncbi:hypothetical protein [Microbispora siamensis]|nr:hypothetical protein [Microbispora siamensis]